MTRGGDKKSIRKFAEPRVKAPPGAPKRGGPDAASTARKDNIGKALRSVYDETLTENIPDSMLDLLRKLD